MSLAQRAELPNVAEVLVAGSIAATVTVAATAVVAAAANAAAGGVARARMWEQPEERLRKPEMSLPSAWASAFELNPEEPPLGGGAFAKIFRLVERASGQSYAMKVIYRPNFAMRGIEAQIGAEIEAMRRCANKGRCRHVVRVCDTAEENDFVYIRLEVCHFDLLRLASSQPNHCITESAALVWCQQLLTGLRDLHSLGILHRDIKPENLLCTSDGTLKIADFGWCAQIQEAPSSLAGTFQYMAPEILGQQGVQTEAVDVWSAGVTILQLLTGRQLLTTYLGQGCTGLSVADPHQATKVKTARLLVEICERCPPAEESRPSHLSIQCWDLLRRMLIPEATKRITVIDALAHPWLQQGSCVDETTGTGLSREAQSVPLTASMPILQVPTPARAPTPSKSARKCRRSETAPHNFLQGSPRRSRAERTSSPSPDRRDVNRARTGDIQCSALEKIATLEDMGLMSVRHQVPAERRGGSMQLRATGNGRACAWPEDGRVGHSMEVPPAGRFQVRIATLDEGKVTDKADRPQPRAELVHRAVTGPSRRCDTSPTGPLGSPQASPTAKGRAGATKKDLLSSTLPDFLSPVHQGTSGVAFGMMGGDNDSEGSAKVPGIQWEVKPTEMVSRTVVVHQWVPASSSRVQMVQHQLQPQAQPHVAGAERCRMSPRTRVTSITTRPPMVAQGTLRTSQPTVTNLDAFRDTAFLQRPFRPSS